MGKRPANGPQAQEPVPVAEGSSVQFFHDLDLTDVSAPFVLRRSDPQRRLPMLQSHGWIDGALLSGTLEEATARFDASDRNTWPTVVPSPDLVFHDRYHRKTVVQPLRVPLERVREPSDAPPRLSMVFARWGGKHRIGEDHEVETEGDGGWGGYGCPPCDWYMDAVVKEGVMRHPALGTSTHGGSLEVEVLSLFLGSTADVKRIGIEAAMLEAELRGEKKAGFWMLWPADWEADWGDADFVGYVERRSLFEAMTALEGAGVRAGFPHPASLYSLITSKAWMATLSEEPKSRLPAGVLVDRGDIGRNPRVAAANALTKLQAIRAKSVFAAAGGPSSINRAKTGLQKGVAKLGWSWEARHVWFWTGQRQLADCLHGLMSLPGCQAERCIVQEWVDFDFELRLFFFPPGDWAPPADLQPEHFEYTSWATRPDSDAPGAFMKYTHAQCLAQWRQDEVAMASAHAQAIEASQFLIGWLLETHPEPVPMIRMDFMLKHVGPGKAQVVFGEFCEMGACCLKWEQGPPTVWRAALDGALR